MARYSLSWHGELRDFQEKNYPHAIVALGILPALNTKKNKEAIKTRDMAIGKRQKIIIMIAKSIPSPKKS